ncbi:hypothetical protein GYA93_02700 [Gordonia desulfuricans]|uniref:Mce-associated membrane protein n=1 Tax=Gordonia desulfuricans TaxID=89051 RepID=A0A7K3LJR2_9ACTN|nr:MULTISPECIES: hypothetical protein [Gordonia]EMP15097.1 hypothetical protein ISGA_436 [Gordonia sp. NB41Y]NDK88495.1 hypothetical protein [Gordonia desulfuricans]WLP92052.1 hypothetical protein Q9K23_07375 [Gordonia sp. NB41Y]
MANKQDSSTAGKQTDRSASIRTIGGVVAIVAVLAAAVCVAIFGYRAYDVYTSQGPTQSARDEATGAAEQAMLNVTTIDPKDMAGFDKRLESSFAGDALTQVRQQIVGSLEPTLKQAGDQVGSTSSRIVRSAPTEVNADENSAQVLVYLAVTGKTPGQAAETPNTMGFLVGMSKIDGTWKAVKVTPLDGIAVQPTESAQNGSTPSSEAPAGGN